MGGERRLPVPRPEGMEGAGAHQPGTAASGPDRPGPRRPANQDHARSHPPSHSGEADGGAVPVVSRRQGAAVLTAAGPERLRRRRGGSSRSRR
ncbi:MAG: hypothetical protein FJW79_09475 [Actinobacteria bacterium]|nr:hypothetical protein [Actinomycetota bacterium]